MYVIHLLIGYFAIFPDIKMKITLTYLFKGEIESEYCLILFNVSSDWILHAKDICQRHIHTSLHLSLFNGCIAQHLSHE